MQHLSIPCLHHLAKCHLFGATLLQMGLARYCGPFIFSYLTSGAACMGLPAFAVRVQALFSGLLFRTVDSLTSHQHEGCQSQVLSQIWAGPMLAGITQRPLHSALRLHLLHGIIAKVDKLNLHPLLLQPAASQNLKNIQKLYVCQSHGQPPMSHIDSCQYDMILPMSVGDFGSGRSCKMLHCKCDIS